MSGGPGHVNLSHQKHISESYLFTSAKMKQFLKIKHKKSPKPPQQLISLRDPSSIAPGPSNPIHREIYINANHAFCLLLVSLSLAQALSRSLLLLLLFIYFNPSTCTAHSTSRTQWIRSKIIALWSQGGLLSSDVEFLPKI